MEGYNATTYEIKGAHAPISRVHKRSISDPDFSERRSRRAAPPIGDAGISPLDVSYANNFIPKLHKDWVSPMFSSIVYTTDDIQKAFFLLMMLIIIGEFFAAPAITLADSAVITLLGEDADKYGHQRMFGSLGWGLAMFFVGIALDHSTAFPNHPCGPEQQEKNYAICFATFSVLMGAALLTATQIRFKYDFDEGGPQSASGQAAMQADAGAQQQQAYEDEMQNQLAAQLQLPSLAVGGAGLSGPPPAALGAQTKVFAQTTRDMPEWMTVIRQFKDIKCASFLFVAWFMGFGIGLIFTFLFWHLQDFGGSPTLFGVASVINHISEIFAYFFSFRLITQIGHVKVLCLGLVGNILRFLYISWLTNPWYVLPFEFMQGITHAAVWASCCSYIAHNTPQQLRASAQGVLQGIHHGLGRGCGAVIGGIFVKNFGTTSTFRGYGECACGKGSLRGRFVCEGVELLHDDFVCISRTGIICIFVLIGFIFINFYRKEEGFVTDIPQTEDPHKVRKIFNGKQIQIHIIFLRHINVIQTMQIRQVAEETSHLAPHGVPSNPIPRALSSNRLTDLQSQADSYGTYQTTGGALDIPGGNGGGGGNGQRNPFAH